MNFRASYSLFPKTFTEPVCDMEKYQLLSCMGFLVLFCTEGEGVGTRRAEFGRTGLGTDWYATWRGEGTVGE